MRKPAFCISCENKDADQLRGNREADQRLFFRYIVQSLYFLNAKFQAFSHLVRFYSLVRVDLVGNPKDRFSHKEAHLSCYFPHGQGLQCLSICLHLLDVFLSNKITLLAF